MRPYFTEEKNLKRRAQRNVERGTVAMRRWWCKKYNRPPNDPLYLNRSTASINQELYEDLFSRKDEIEQAIENNEGTAESNLGMLNAIRKALGEDEVSNDPLWDQWEADLEAGREPDLDAKVPHG